MSIDNATFVVQRGDTQFSCLGSELGNKLLDDDLLIAQDPDGNIVSVKKALLLVDYSNEPWHPDNLTGAKWLRIHIKNVTISNLSVKIPGSGTNSGIYRLSDGAKVSSPLPFDDGEEYIVLGYDTRPNLNQDAGIQLKSHYANWELGELTNVSNITNGWQMFKGAINFNTPMPGKYFHTPNMQNMTQFMADCASFNQDLSDWCLPNSPGLNETWRGTALESNYNLQPNYGECNVEQAPLPGENVNDCLFVVTDGDNGNKSVTGAQVKELLKPTPKWELVNVGTDSWTAIAYANNKFMAAGGSKAMYSSDGLNWTKVDLPNSANGEDCVCYGNGKWVILSTRKSMVSEDGGDTWTEHDMPSTSSAWRAITYGNNKFIAASRTKIDTETVAYSTDGKNWTAINPGRKDLFSSVEYGNSTYVLAADSVSGPMYSADGISWTSSGSLSCQSNKVAFGDSAFVTVGWSGSGRAAYSTDNGVSFTLSNVPELNNFRGVTYGNGLFVAVAKSGDNRIMYSEDKGENWSMQAAPEDNEWYSIAFGANKFVAVARNGTNRVMWIDSL